MPAAVVEGAVRGGFEAVREAFADNFARRSELGGACCAYHRGEKVVDLWGGIRDTQTNELWERDTMVIVYSATKGLSAMTMALAHSRGWLDYEEYVCRYWPAFAQQGKERITVRQLLSHQAGLYALDQPLDRALVADLDRLAVVLARQKPAWEPGTRQAYHAITLGFYEGELLRRIEPEHRSLGQFFQDEIASPLGLEAYIRLPESIPHARSEAPNCRTIRRAFMPATSKSRPAAPSPRPAASHRPTVPLPAAATSWGCVRRRWICFPPRQFLPRAASTMSA
jgi:CubicO group peptidase (beta-lactamase class C family)